MRPQRLPSMPAQTHAWQEVAENDTPFGDDPFALAVASGTSVREAARSSGLSERTGYRRLQDPTFRRRVSEIRALFLGEAVGRLSEAANEAVSTLKALLAARSEPVRLSAARAILELGPKLREQAELEERIAALERAAREEQHGEEAESDDDES